MNDGAKMGIIDLFSKRQKRLRGETPDVYRYDEIPHELRVQVVHIWRDAFGDIHGSYPGAKAFQYINESLCREYGLFELKEYARDYLEAVTDFLLRTKNTEQAIDIIELSFWTIDSFIRGNRHHSMKVSPDDAIAELNARFREHGVGYQFESGQIIRVDSQLIHQEVVKPALAFLSGKLYEGANQEFLSAHAHYRDGKAKECLNDCLKALESTMKAICEKRKWPYGPKDAAKDLIDMLFSKGLVPSFMQSHFGGLRATLADGVPTIRNRLGAHGQGAKRKAVPESIASYALHLTASAIVLLVKAESEMK